MRSGGSRQIHYAGHSVTVEYDHPVVETILNNIIYPFPSTIRDKNPSTLRVEYQENQKPTFTLSLNGAQIYKSNHQIDFAEMLLSKICYQLAFHSKDGMLFHAAGLGYNDHGILVPGGIGYGKSTFTAWMVSQGCDYLSDEFVYFAWGSRQMQSFPRPLHLKKPSRDVLSQMINYKSDENLIHVGSHSDLVHPNLFKPNNLYTQPPVQLILFPHYQANAEFEWHELSPAETGLELMQFLINARNLPEHGLSEISSLARKTKAIKFNYSAFSQIENLMINYLNQVYKT